MQYSVSGPDGSQYGPVDLMTLKQWVQEGRVTPTSEVTDHLSNQKMQASSISELGFSSAAPAGGAAPYAASAPPSAYTDYPRTDQMPVQGQGTKLWAILIWLGIAFVFSLFTMYGGLIISGWNILDAFQARSRRDPKAGLCMAVAVGGFLLIAIWTYVKFQVVGPR